MYDLWHPIAVDVVDTSDGVSELATAVLARLRDREAPRIGNVDRDLGTEGGACTDRYLPPSRVALSDEVRNAVTCQVPQCRELRRFVDRVRVTGARRLV